MKLNELDKAFLHELYSPIVRLIKLKNRQIELLEKLIDNPKLIGCIGSIFIVKEKYEIKMEAAEIEAELKMLGVEFE
jgi:small ligand-binding sensory domain FIST